VRGGRRSPPQNPARSGASPLTRLAAAPRSTLSREGRGKRRPALLCKTASRHRPARPPLPASARCTPSPLAGEGWGRGVAGSPHLRIRRPAGASPLTRLAAAPRSTLSREGRGKRRPALLCKTASRHRPARPPLPASARCPPSPLAGEGGGEGWQVLPTSEPGPQRRQPPHPSRGCAAIHPLPRGERGCPGACSQTLPPRRPPPLSPCGRGVGGEGWRALSTSEPGVRRRQPPHPSRGCAAIHPLPQGERGCPGACSQTLRPRRLPPLSPCGRGVGGEGWRVLPTSESGAQRRQPPSSLRRCRCRAGAQYARQPAPRPARS